MQIKTTTILNISQENLPLLGVVLENMGYTAWKNGKIQEARDTAYNIWINNLLEVDADGNNIPQLPFTFDESTVENIDSDTFIKTVLSTDAKTYLYRIIVPAIDSYFGVAGKAQAEVVKGLLDTAIISTVDITTE